MLHVLLDFLSPPHCALCNTPLEESSILCECCLEDLPDTLWNPYTPLMDGLASVRCLDDYSNTAGRLVRLSKYAKRGDIARLLGLHMGTVCGGITQQCDAIVPVPQHWKSTLTRGFSPVETIAAEISRAQNIPMQHALQRKGGRRLAVSSPSNRTEIARSQFVATKKLEQHRILLVDDIITTGATAKTCASLLKKQGASEVHFVAIASPLM